MSPLIHKIRPILWYHDVYPSFLICDFLWIQLSFCSHYELSLWIKKSFWVRCPMENSGIKKFLRKTLSLHCNNFDLTASSSRKLIFLFYFMRSISFKFLFFSSRAPKNIQLSKKRQHLTFCIIVKLAPGPIILKFRHLYLYFYFSKNLIKILKKTIY